LIGPQSVGVFTDGFSLLMVAMNKYALNTGTGIKLLYVWNGCEMYKGVPPYN